MAAAFSPIMMQAAIVFPDTRVGMMEASATLGKVLEPGAEEQ
jgi:hypothetical protein